MKVEIEMETAKLALRVLIEEIGRIDRSFVSGPRAVSAYERLDTAIVNLHAAISRATQENEKGGGE